MALTNVNVNIYKTQDMSAVEGLQKAGRTRGVSFIVSCGEIKGKPRTGTYRGRAPVCVSASKQRTKRRGR